MATVEEAADEVRIRAVIGRAGYLGDEGTPDDYREIYTDDATWSLGSTLQTGIEEIVAATVERRAQGVSGPGTGTRHLVVPMDVRVDGDTAEAVSYFLFLAETSTAPVVRVFGTYRDTLARGADGTWRIRQRRAGAG